jgi:hypothetical protein
MSIIYVPEHQPNSFYDRKLPNGKYRYEGYRHGIHYCIDTNNSKTEDDICDFLDNCSIDYLLDNEKYIIILKD